MTEAGVLPIDRGFIHGVLAAPGGDDNKYTRGVALVATGSPTYPGAAVLCVRGALAAGPGMVRYLGPQRCEDLILGQAPEVVMGGGRFQVALVGSGWDGSMATHVEALARQCAQQQLPLIVDAGALPAVREWAQSNPFLVATPHPGEAERMFAQFGKEVSRQEIERDLPAAARSLAALCGALIVLKGAATVVAGPRTDPFLFTAPAGWGATAGAGDVLAGVISGVVAGATLRPRHWSGAIPEERTNNQAKSCGDTRWLSESVAAAVGLHGFAAGVASGALGRNLELSGAVGRPIVAGDIAAAVPGVVGEILGKGNMSCTS